MKKRLQAKDLSSRDNFSRWVFDFHNQLNADLSKPKYKVNWKDTKERFEVFRAACTRSDITQHSGCSDALGERIKTKCLIKFVPFDHPEQTSVKIDKACFARGRSKDS